MNKLLLIALVAFSAIIGFLIGQISAVQPVVTEDAAPSGRFYKDAV